MARKKIVFVIVEGASEADALETIIDRLLTNDTVHVHITHGDLTTRTGTTTTNIVSRVVDEIRRFATSNHYNKNDFKEIVHIVDMDGAYIPDISVVEDATAINPIYSLTEIRTNKVENIINRNHQKAANLNRLASCKEIWSISYSVFYMSCNLDHVLHNKLNISDEEKEHNAHQFARKYRNDLLGFLVFISDSDFSIMGGYKESWDFIRQIGLHSLERHTNFGLFFQEDQTECTVDIEN